MARFQTHVIRIAGAAIPAARSKKRPVNPRKKFRRKDETFCRGSRHTSEGNRTQPGFEADGNRRKQFHCTFDESMVERRLFIFGNLKEKIVTEKKLEQQVEKKTAQTGRPVSQPKVTHQKDMLDETSLDGVSGGVHKA
jgi:hypothetical protein